MKQLSALFLFLMMALNGTSQYATFNMTGNNSEGLISTNGFLFYDRGNALPGLTVPSFSGIYSVFASSLWLGAVREDGQLVSTAPVYCLSSSNCDYFPGPLTNDGELEGIIANDEYNRVWSVTLSSIQNHRSYFECLSNPDCDESIEFPNGFTVFPSIEEWPGNGPETGNYDSKLAPYVDFNDNGTYDPENGDYPDICGGNAYFTVLNDAISTQGETGGEPVGVEVRTMVYVYYGFESEIEATYFVNHEIINRNDQQLNDLYLGVWVDFDLGNPVDDYLGTNIQKNMFYAHNGDDFDDSPSFALGYGSDLAAQGVVLLKGPLADADGEDNEMPFSGYDSYGPYFSGYGDGEVDNERLGFTSITQYTNNMGLTFLPFTDQEVYNALQGLRSDGSLFFASDSGSGIGAINPPVTKYIFPGATDPELVATNGEMPSVNGQNIWTEDIAMNPPGDRKGVASIGPLTLEAGESVNIDYAYIFSRDSWSADENEIESLTAKIDNLQAYTCDLTDGILNVSSAVHERKNLAVYPNPAIDQIAFELETSGVLRIYSLEGKKLLEKTVAFGLNTIDVNELIEGIYIVEVLARDGRFTQKLVIQD